MISFFGSYEKIADVLKYKKCKKIENCTSTLEFIVSSIYNLCVNFVSYKWNQTIAKFSKFSCRLASHSLGFLDKDWKSRKGL